MKVFVSSRICERAKEEKAYFVGGSFDERAERKLVQILEVKNTTSAMLVPR